MGGWVVEGRVLSEEVHRASGSPRQQGLSLQLRTRLGGWHVLPHPPPPPCLPQLDSRLPAEQEVAVRAAQRQLQVQATVQEEAEEEAGGEITAAASAAGAGPSSHAVPEIEAAAGPPVAAAVVAGAAAAGGLGGLMRKLTGSRSSKEEEKAAKEAAAAQEAEEAAARQAAAEVAAVQSMGLTPREGSNPSLTSPRDFAPESVVLVQPPGGGPPVPMVPLAAMGGEDPAVLYQMGVQAGVAAALKHSPSRQHSSSRRAGSVSGRATAAGRVAS